MKIHKIIIAATAIILTTLTFSVAAQAANDNAGRGAGQSPYNNKQGMHQPDNHRMQGRDDTARDHDVDQSQGNRKSNENSNRQSDPGSTRGLERAAERHSEHADNAGPQGQAEKESHWYDFMFGRNKKAEGNMEEGYETTGKKQRWWWPFN